MNKLVSFQPGFFFEVLKNVGTMRSNELEFIEL
jgi:hypothetical protein